MIDRDAIGRAGRSAATSLPEEAHAAMMQVMSGEATPAQIAALPGRACG